MSWKCWKYQKMVYPCKKKYIFAMEGLKVTAQSKGKIVQGFARDWEGVSTSKGYKKPADQMVTQHSSNKIHKQVL